MSGLVQADDILTLNQVLNIQLKRDIEELHFIFARNKVERELNKRLEQEIIERIESMIHSFLQLHRKFYS
jgi:hypothetical protein